MDETIASILLEFDLDLFRPIVPRRLSLGGILPPRAGNLVKVITGMRGSGKSYRLFQEMNALDRGPMELIQVTDTLSDPKTAEREMRALWEALGEARLEEGLLIVGSGDDGVYEQDGMRIRQIPAWKWFLAA